MYLVKISCVLLVFLCSVDNWRASGATQRTRPSQGTASLGVAQQPHQGSKNLLQPFTPSHSVQFDEFFRRNEDGTYEYRHAIANGGLHYEQSYKATYQGKEFFAVRGFYSYQLPDGKFLTVYYTADQDGFRQTSSTITLRQPELPRSLGKPTE